MDEDTAINISRRDLIRRGAIVGGAALWVPPVIQSLRLPAYGQVGSPPPDRGFDISFVALLLTCGTEQFLYRIKFEEDGGIECGPQFNTGDCSEKLMRGNPKIQVECPPGVSATMNGDGSVTVVLGSCTQVDDFIVKCGQCCAGPGEGGQPDLPPPGAALITFVPCSSNAQDCL